MAQECRWSDHFIGAFRDEKSWQISADKSVAILHLG